MNFTGRPATFIFAIRIMIHACFILRAAEVHAHHSHATQLSGTVERIDQEKHLLLVKPHEHGESLLLQWGRWTTFVKDGEIASASALNLGHAEIYYRVPFFGKPTLEKIIWKGNPKTRAHSTSGIHNLISHAHGETPHALRREVHMRIVGHVVHRGEVVGNLFAGELTQAGNECRQSSLQAGATIRVC